MYFCKKKDMYIVNIKIPDSLKGKIKINLPQPIDIKEVDVKKNK